MTRTIRADHTVDSKVYVRVEYETKTNLRQWYRRPNFSAGHEDWTDGFPTNEENDFYVKYIEKASREYEDARFRYLESLVQGNFSGADNWLSYYKTTLQSLIRDSDVVKQDLEEAIPALQSQYDYEMAECYRGLEGYRQACDMADRAYDGIVACETMLTDLSAWVAEAKSVMASN